MYVGVVRTEQLHLFPSVMGVDLQSSHTFIFVIVGSFSGILTSDLVLISVLFLKTIIIWTDFL